MSYLQCEHYKWLKYSKTCNSFNTNLYNAIPSVNTLKCTDMHLGYKQNNYMNTYNDKYIHSFTCQ